jgi:hypothetical protein
MKLALSVAYLIGVLTIIWAVQSLPDPAPSPVVVAAPDVPGTMAVNVNVTLYEETATPTEVPTAYPTAAATIDISLRWCSNVTPVAGQECLMPPAPTATEAVRPDCPTTPGQWCKFPSADDTEGGQDVE